MDTAVPIPEPAIVAAVAGAVAAAAAWVGSRPRRMIPVRVRRRRR